MRFQKLLEAEFSDIDQLCANVRSWDVDFRPLARPPNGDPVAHLIQSRCGPLEFGYAQLSATLDQYGSPPPSRLTFVVLEARLCRLWWRGQDVARDSVLVFPVGSELRCVSGPDFEIHTISVSEETVGLVCEALGLAMPTSQSRVEVFRPPLAVIGALRGHLRLIRHGHGAPAAPDARLILELLVQHWLQPPHQHDVRRAPLRLRDRAVRRCLERMDAADWTSLSSATLCETAGVCERTLQYAFRERFGLSPAAFLKARRLAAVRRALQTSEGPRHAVGDLAAKYGFWHVGQFAADYRRAYGETPSQTLWRFDVSS